MPIRILSFDFDGCLYNRNVKNGDIIKTNLTLLDAIKKENILFKSTHTFIGSARQSHEIDLSNRFQNLNGSCFESIAKVASYLQSTFENYLLADLYGDLVPGTSYNRAMNTEINSSLEQKIRVAALMLLNISLKNPQLPPIAFGLSKDSKIDLDSITNALYSLTQESYLFYVEALQPLNASLKQAGWKSEETSLSDVFTKEFYQGEHKQWCFDKSKVSILYAQMHKMATEYPGEDFVFEFYDDRPDILKNLKDFFTKFPYLIPHNLKLKLHQYAGEINPLFSEIQGKGIIDKTFANTIKNMTDLILDKGKNRYAQQINIAESTVLISKLEQNPEMNPFVILSGDKQALELDLTLKKATTISESNSAVIPVDLSRAKPSPLLSQSILSKQPQAHEYKKVLSKAAQDREEDQLADFCSIM